MQALKARLRVEEIEKSLQTLQIETAKESDGEGRKRTEVKRGSPVLKWRELPEETFNVVDGWEVKGAYGPGVILRLESEGETTKVWACARVIRVLKGIRKENWNTLKINNKGMKRSKKTGYEYFDVEIW